jgi:hypothetical protein
MLEILHHFPALVVSSLLIEDNIKINFLEEQEPLVKMLSSFYVLEFAYLYLGVNKIEKFLLYNFP